MVLGDLMGSAPQWYSGVVWDSEFQRPPTYGGRGCKGEGGNFATRNLSTPQNWLQCNVYLFLPLNSNLIAKASKHMMTKLCVISSLLRLKAPLLCRVCEGWSLHDGCISWSLLGTPTGLWDWPNHFSKQLTQTKLDEGYILEKAVDTWYFIDPQVISTQNLSILTLNIWQHSTLEKAGPTTVSLSNVLLRKS